MQTSARRSTVAGIAAAFADLDGAHAWGSLRGDDRLAAQTGQTGAQRRAVIAPLRHQALGVLARASRLAGAADGDGVEGLLAQGDCRRRCRLQGYAQRRTCALDYTIQFLPLPRLVVPTFGPPGGRTSSCRRPCLTHARHPSPFLTTTTPNSGSGAHRSCLARYSVVAAREYPKRGKKCS